MCVVLLAILAVVQVAHTHQGVSDADHCPLCIVMHTAAPVVAAAPLIALVQVATTAPVLEVSRLHGTGTRSSSHVHLPRAARHPSVAEVSAPDAPWFSRRRRHGIAKIHRRDVPDRIDDAAADKPGFSFHHSHPWEALLCRSDYGLILGKLSAVALLCGALAASAQGGNAGAVHGTVTDSSGAVIPGATVHLANSVSGLDRTATTDATGQFTFSNVPFNPYQVSVKAHGFCAAFAELSRFDRCWEPR